MIVLGSMDLGSCIGHEGEASVDGINVFKKDPTMQADALQSEPPGKPNLSVCKCPNF